MISSDSDSGSDPGSASETLLEEAAAPSGVVDTMSGMEESLSPPVVCIAPCCDLETAISSQPYQAKSKHILDKTKKLQGNKFRQFRSEWYNAYPWLVLCTTSFKAFCYFCKYCSYKGYLLDKNTDEAFVINGFNNWKKSHERFKQHAKSNSHKESKPNESTWYRCST